MPEYIMEYDIDETGKLINARRKEKLIRCKDCINHQYDAIFNIAWCNGQAVKPDGYCDAGKRTGTGKQQQRCDTCKHEKERWFSRCADCSDFELWESKE